MGFFFNEQKRKRVRKRAPGSVISAGSIEVLYKERCNACPLDKERLLNPKMPPSGSDRPIIYMLGEAPGKEEDERGEQFVGSSGRLLRPTVPKRWKNKIRWNNTIRCRPPKNRDPTQVETECCRQFIIEDIERTKPEAIFGFGNVPLRWLTGYSGIGLWRGRRIPVLVGKHKCWYFPMHHPAYIDRIHGARQSDLNADVERNFYRDLEGAFGFLEGNDQGPVVFSSGYMDNIDWVMGSCLADLEKVKRWLDELRGNEINAIDIETQGLKPYKKGALLLTCAIGTLDKTYAFPVDHPHASWGGRRNRDRVITVFEDFLYDSDTLICQNLQFELEWFVWYYGLGLLEHRHGLWEDTMSASYVLDERKGMHNLGIMTKRWLGFNVKALSPPMNMANMVDEPLEKVLPYNCLDAKYTEALWQAQMDDYADEDNARIRKGYAYHVDLCSALVAAQSKGLHPNHEALESIGNDLASKIEGLEDAIQSDKDVRRFKRKYHDFNPYSATKDLLIFFRDFLKLDEGKTDKNKQGYSTDDKMLERIKGKVPMASMLQELRTATKNKANYIDGTLNVIDPDGLIHTTYTHTHTATTRLSSEDPNVQNYPARKDHYIRAVIAAPKGKRLVALDYGQIDARNIAIYSNDPYYIDALYNNYDIHMDWTHKLLQAYPKVQDITIANFGLDKNVDDEELIRTFRKVVKNKWTFPLFYGSTDEQSAVRLEIPIRKITPLFEEFWDTFKGVRAWQERIMEDYRQQGFIETFGGHRLHGPLKANELLNRPIQCATAEIVGNAMIRTGAAGYWCNINVHDELVFTIADDGNFDRVVADIARIMCLVPFDWVTVPIVVEVSEGPDWHDMKPYGVHSSEEFK